VLVNGFFSKNSIDANVADAGQHMRLVRDVVTLGDYGLRTGDIVRRDSNGYVRFEDRTFEIFRQQGHNVSTSQIVLVLRRIEGIADVGVTHVTLPNTDGQLGLAVIVPASNFDIGSLARCYGKLAPFERPRFLRLTKALRLNPRYKFDHAFYRREGVNPEGTSEPVFVFQKGAFQPITLEVWAKLSLGEFRI